MEASDRVLIERTLAGNKDAFGELVARHGAGVYTLCRRLLGDETEADDAVQDTFLQAYRKLDTFRGDSAFSTWLHRIAANECLMRLRRRRPLLSTETPAEEEKAPPRDIPDWANAPVDELLTKELREELERAVESLPEHYRTVFVLRDLENESTEEVARQLGISIPAVKTRLHRARTMLRDRLREYMDNGGGR